MSLSSVPIPMTTPQLMLSMDSIPPTVKNSIPNQEYLLQGSIMDTAVEVLLHRLRGLCDNVDSGSDRFQDLEMSFGIRGNHPQPVLRVRKALDDPEAPWHLRYIGQPELGDKSRPTIVRNVIDVACSDNVVEFLNELGFQLEFEFITRGYMFRKGRMKITVAKLCKQSKPQESMEPLSASHLVELSVVAPTGQDAIADDIKSFAEQLRPLVQLDKIDYRRL